jgi:hypothetical protein
VSVWNWKVFLSLIAILITAGVYPVKAEEFSVKQLSAPIRYGGESSNAEMAVHNGSIYVAYADEDFMLTVARRDGISGEWTKATQIDKTLGKSDPSHNQIALAIDGDGFIHVWYGMHDFQDMRYARSNQPDDIVSGFTVRGDEFPDTNDSYTYPNAAAAPNGDIYFSVRKNSRFLPLFRWDNALKIWQEIAVFADGRAALNDRQTYTPYLPWLFVDSDNNVHLKWDWAFGTARSERHLGSYALYKPSTGMFYRADGTAYTLPITVATADIFQSMPDGVTWNDEGIALSDLAVDSHNQPIISYAFSPVGALDNWQHRVAHWDGANWVQTVLTSDTKKWNKDFLIADQTTVYYYARTIAGTELWTSADNGNTWSIATLVYTRPVDGAVQLAPDLHILLHLSSTTYATESEFSFLQISSPANRLPID